MTKEIILYIAAVMFFAMFIYSGVNKIMKFDQKVVTLKDKSKVSDGLAKFGLILVIILEIVGSLYIIFYILFFKDRQSTILYYLALTALFCFLLFMIVVTFLYHPPSDKIIPFLSNVTTFGGFLLILYTIIN